MLKKSVQPVKVGGVTNLLVGRADECGAPIIVVGGQWVLVVGRGDPVVIRGDFDVLLPFPIDLQLRVRHESLELVVRIVKVFPTDF